MITITHDYEAINHPDMTDNFIIRPDKVIQVWDINEGEVGIRFISSYDKYPYSIKFEGSNKTLLASDILMMMKTDSDTFDTKLNGIVKIK